MIGEGEEELICDLAETYHIYNYKSLPPSKVAIFSVGLREESRIYRKLLGLPASNWNERLLALILDVIKRAFSSDEDVKSVYSILFGEEEQQKDVVSFESGEDFEEARRRIINGN